MKLMWHKTVRYFKVLFRSPSNQRGFTLLLAALVSSIVLMLGSAVFTIAIKQVTLSSLGRDSQYAFYAADSAAECALFWDWRSDLSLDTFATSTSKSSVATLPSCDGNQNITLTTYSQISTAATSTFYYAAGGHCVFVYVAKHRNPVTNGVSTVIHADGYSTTVSGSLASQLALCTPSDLHANPFALPDVIINDTHALQRSVELIYE